MPKDLPADLPAPDEAAAVRGADGRFVKGNPGGPGRPRRAVNEAADALDQIAVEAARELIDVAIAQARKGNMVALKLVLDRGWPVHRRRPVAIEAPALAQSGDFLPAQAALTDAVLSGDVTPNEGAVIASLLEEQRRRVKMQEIDEEYERRRAEADDEDDC
jgi:hypothetical protein